MNPPGASTAVSDIELTAVKSSPDDTDHRVDAIRITFLTHVGWDGALVLFLSLGIAGLLVYIYNMYTKSFVALHRPWVWIFLVLAVLYVLYVLIFLCSWKKKAIEFTLEQQVDMNQVKQSTLKRTQSAAERAQMAARRAQQLYGKLQVNGPFFLWKLYATELFESGQQCANLLSVYLCCLPVVWTASLCLVLAADCAHTSMTMVHSNTPSRRNRQVKIDTIIDVLCVTVPLSGMWFAYNIPISLPEMLSVSLLPVVSILSKLDDILEEGVRHRSALQVYAFQSKSSRSMKRNRESVFQHLSHTQIAQQQEAQVPRPVRLCVAGTKGLFGLFFLMVALVHLAIVSDKPQFEHCDKVTWEDGCVSKIPFCKSLFAPTCNCASLKLENNHSVTSLPNRLADDMVGLRRVFIRNCNLTQLPPKMEQLTEMVYFEVSKNRLQAFNVDIREWKNLDNLVLMHNKISVYNEEALWSHPELSGLVLHNNRITLPDSSRIYLPSLMFLSLKDNGLRIAQTLGRDQFPNLFHMHLNGNHLLNFPDQALKNQLGYLAVARCQLKSLPSYLSEFKQLVFLDARGNNITNVDDNLKLLMERNGVETYFAGNDVCSTDSSLDCEPLCSKHCWSRRVSNDGYCDVDCGTEECQFDGGDCNDLKKTAL